MTFVLRTSRYLNIGIVGTTFPVDLEFNLQLKCRLKFSTPPHLSGFSEIAFFTLPNTARFCGLKILCLHIKLNQKK